MSSFFVEVEIYRDMYTILDFKTIGSLIFQIKHISLIQIILQTTEVSK